MENYYKKTNKRRTKQLGMSPGAAMNRLKKLLLFKYAKLAKANVCVRCGKEIVSANNFTVDHKINWLDNDVVLFWDTDNVGFSHTSCNCKSRRKVYFVNVNSASLRALKKYNDIRRKPINTTRAKRTCNVCKRSLYLKHFGTDSYCKLGISYKCRKCAALLRKALKLRKRGLV